MPVGFSIWSQVPSSKAIVPVKRSYADMLDADNQQPAASNLSHLTCISATDCTEMNEDIATILNIDRTRRPWMRVVCARATEGLILVNKSEGLLVNCAEVYSRYPTLDAHHEQTKIKRNQSLNTTLPQPTTKYPNVELFSVKNDNCYKLELGTKIMNVLITSSIRIDKNHPPAVGPSSTNGFNVIFIRRSFIEWYGNLRQRGFNNLSIRELYPFDEYACKHYIVSSTKIQYAALIKVFSCYDLDTCRPQHWHEQGFRCKDSIPVASSSRGICLGTR
ncbi:hypothetical protein FB192DRAFT_1328788 [Mucor lusitanicus]|uniref:Uncharacterized protein n=1 Tax=Mucor circinelloides f. lusitanicus TaxID=29924 RepID=A0A8H4BGQ6_MUCCL|nr:hypothetical protein FB192DRAFT_1328788 [Mucor lusitanicus]